MRSKFIIEFTGECDFETLKREFNLPATIAFEDAAEYIKKDFLKADTENIMNVEVSVLLCMR